MFTLNDSYNGSICVTASRVELQRSKTSNDRHAIAEKLLATVYNHVKIAEPAKLK